MKSFLAILMKGNTLRARISIVWKYSLVTASLDLLEIESISMWSMKNKKCHVYIRTHIYKHIHTNPQKKKCSGLCRSIRCKMDIFWWRSKCIWMSSLRFPGLDWDRSVNTRNLWRSFPRNICERARETGLRGRTDFFTWFQENLWNSYVARIEKFLHSP